MALTKQQKSAQVSDLTEKLQKAQSVVFTSYLGLTVAKVSELRRKLKTGNAEMKVMKKTLMGIAAKQAGLPEVPENELPGAVACIVSYSEPTAGAQIAKAFSKDNPQVSFVAGIFGGQVLSKAAAIALASIPPRPVLLATFAGMIQAPLRSFASICNSPLSSFARGVSELAKKKESAPSS
jgi:large subunit ribosomal protein L10